MTARSQRFTRAHPCPICGGHDGLARGKARRCYGYLDDRGAFARCTREEKAGGLSCNRDGTYSHRLYGLCPCGQTHGGTVASIAPGRRAAPRRAESFPSFAALDAALRQRYGAGVRVTHWIYRDGTGAEVFRVLRIDSPDAEGTSQKTYRPCHRGGDGRWRLAKPSGLLPLYNLPAVRTAPRAAIIPVLEGEKCVEIALHLGLPYATTSAHGAHAPRLTDWSPLAGRRVAVLPDAGTSGAEYASKVAAILAALSPPAEVRIVQLPGLRDGDDIEQWRMTARAAGHSEESFLRQLIGLIENGLQAPQTVVCTSGAVVHERAAASPSPTGFGSNHQRKENKMSNETTGNERVKLTHPERVKLTHLGL